MRLEDRPVEGPEVLRNRLARLLIIQFLILAWVLVGVVVVLGPGGQISELGVGLGLADTAISWAMLRQVRDRQASQLSRQLQSLAAQAPRGFEFQPLDTPGVAGR